ncbi:MAG TPA: tetratricopeptide repeat protein [Hyphomicrobiaceae bacterium]|nr:tetratricopeptide repeat protein [Hyphomicrobiaceae bacterium]
MLPIAVLFVLALAGPAASQSTGEPPRSEQPKKSEPPPGKGAPATPPTGKGATAPNAADPLKLNQIPETSEAKVKLLRELYALLATAEDAESANRISSRIERLWSHSGSDTVTLLMERANAAMSNKKAELALELLDRAVKLAPDYPEAFNRRAFVHFTENNFAGAVGDLRRALALDPNHYKAMDGLVQIWREVGNKRGAYYVLKQLVDVHPFWAGAKQVLEELKKEVEGQDI